ncbi:MAG: thiamine diphosphokinase [Prevotella sp.]|nr:thiamine diphosphokinase [Prevotella sp.]
MSKFDAVIVANGEFPCHPIPQDILKNAPHVVACDGAAQYVDADIIIGDGDSVPAALRKRLVLVNEQDDNDLTKATRYCLEKGWKSIAYLGCTGRREDHMLGNVSLLMRYYRDMAVDGVMYTDHGWFTPARGDRTFDALPGQQVSIFNFSCTRIASEGLKWDSYAYQEWWQGTLNEALATRFSLCADGCYLVYRTYDVKHNM